MAEQQKGPVIPIVIDIDSSAKEAIKKWEKYNKEFYKIGEKYIAQASNAGLDDKQFMKVVDSLTSLNNEANNTEKTIKALSERSKALREILSTTDPKSNEWKVYTKELKMTLTQLNKLEAKIAKINSTVTFSSKLSSGMRATATTIDGLTQRYNALMLKLKTSKPGTAVWDKYAAKLKETKMRLDALNNSLAQATTIAPTVVPKIEVSMSQLNSNVVKLNAGFTLLNSYAGRFVTRMGVLAGISFVGNILRNVRDITAQFELQRVALSSILQDSYKAGELFNRIKAAAIESPFEIKELVNYTKQLSAYQIEEEKLFDTMMRLADISAGLGVDMQRLILAFGQVKSASVLRGQELRQFTEAGIPLVQKLAEKFSELNEKTVTTGEVFDLISKRAVSFEMVDEILRDMTEAGGMFYRMQEKQAHTLAGELSNLKDSYAAMYDEMGRTKDIDRVMRASIDILKSLSTHWRSVLKVLITFTTSAVSAVATTKLLTLSMSQLRFATQTEAAETVKLAASQTMFAKIGKQRLALILGETRATAVYNNQLRKLQLAYLSAARASSVFSKAIAKIKIALLSNPFSAIAFALTSIITSLLVFKKEAQSMEDIINKAQEAGQLYSDTVKRSEDMSLMISQYDTLSKKQNLTEKESVKLRDITSELARVFPKAVVGIDKETNSVILLTDELKKLNDASKEAAKNSLTRQIEKDEEKLNVAIQERDKIIDIIENWDKGGFHARSLKVYEERLLILNGQIVDLNQALENNRKLLAGYDSDTQVKDELLGWRKKLTEFEYDTTLAKNVKTYTAFQVEQFENLDSALSDVVKRYKNLEQQETTLNNAISQKPEESVLTQLNTDLQDIIGEKQALYDILKYFGALGLIEGGSRKRSTSTELVELVKSKADFYKQFHASVESMSKLQANDKAVQMTTKAMRGRASQLGISLLGLDGSSAEYTKKLKTLIDEVKAKIKTYSDASGKNTLTELFGIKTNNTELKQWINLLESLWRTYTDSIIKENEKKIKDAYKRYSEIVKQNKTAQSFYKSFFEISGSKDLASEYAQAIFGSDGKQLEQALKKQLRLLFNQASISNVSEDMRDEASRKFGEGLSDAVSNAINNKDWVTLQRMLILLPEEAKKLAESIVSEGMKADADWLLDLEKTYRKAKDFTAQKEEVSRKAESDRSMVLKKMADGLLSSEEADKYLTAITNYEQRRLNAIDLNILKSTSDWEKAFANLDRVGKTTISDLIVVIDEMIAKLKAAGVETYDPQTMKALIDAREKLIGESERRQGYSTLYGGAKEYLTATQNVNKYRNALKKLTEGTEEYKAKLKELKDAENAQRAGLDKMQVGVDSINKSFTDLGAVFTSLQEIFTQYGMDSDSDLAASFEGVAMAITMIGSALTFVNGILTLMSANPIVLGISAIIASITAIFTIINKIKTSKANKEIKAQEDRINALEKAYSRLENQISKTFGSDYISAYNQQLENLQAKIVAYRKQYDAESGKGKDKDDDKLKDYQDKITDIQYQITDMEKQLSEYFAGTSLASAAEDFANSWIDAYKEFSSTTDAMAEKFQEMVNNMVTKSLAAKVMQTLLQPIFDSIDKAAIDGALTASEIAQISELATSTIPEINNAMTLLMNQLGAAGLNLRNNVSGLSGISKEIASASEESILGLAAGINTQNFYIAQTNDYVFQILTILKGGAISAVTSSAKSSLGDNYLASLPVIADHTSGILRQCEAMVEQCQSIATDIHRVIQPRGSKGSHWVVTN